MTSRQQKRAQERSAARAEDATRVYITVPEEFRDCMGDPWTSQTVQGIVELGFTDALLLTIRRCPVQNAEDSERSLELIETIRGTEDGVIELRRADYDWMMMQLKANAHKTWNAPDAAYLRRTVEAAVSAKKPETEKGEPNA